MSGWVKLYRKISDKAYYHKDSEKVHLWIHILISANHTGREEMLGANPIYCEPGQFTTGRKQLSSETGISESKIERILTYFEKIEQQIEQRKTSVNRLISVNNWSEYQESEQQFEQRLNNDRTTTEQRLNNDWTHLKNIKNIKNIKKKERTVMSDAIASTPEPKSYLSASMENLIKTFDRSSKTSSIYPEFSGDYALTAIGFYELFKKNLIESGAKCTTLKKAKGIWMDDIRLTCENDGYSLDDLREVYIFLNFDKFWGKKILSADKLRKQMDRLKMEISLEKEKQAKKQPKQELKYTDATSKEFCIDF